jgi:predicted HD phosphohydrolase
MDHEKIGQEYLLAKGFSLKIAKLVSSHVEAKRYLTFKYPSYYDRLSDASRITLEHQGGKMNAEEAAAFEKDPLFNEYIKMRTWDDLAKETNIPLPSLDGFKLKAIQHLMN